MKRIPPLDGVRGVGILLVVLCHVQVFLQPLSGAAALFLTDMAWGAMYPFFVLSGYLIGGLMFKEIAAAGDLSVKRFWARRAFRTWPLYFIALAANYLLVTHTEPPSPPLWSFISFTQIFFRMSYFIESWSLSVEELFYLGAPVFAVVVMRLLGRRGFGAACALVICLSYVARLRIGYRLHPATIFDSLFIGMLIAHLELSGNRIFELMRRHAYATLAASAAIFVALYGFTTGPAQVRQFQGFLAVASGLLVIASLNPTTLVSRFLGGRIFKVVAAISYSVYLSHMFVIRALRDMTSLTSTVAPGSAAGWLFCLGALALSMMIGWVVYQLIDRPLLRLRDRVVPRRRQASHADAALVSSPALSSS